MIDHILTIKSGVYQIAKSQKSDDSYIIHDNLLVVADGIGGWRKQLIDPSKYSSSLCRELLSNYIFYEECVKINKNLKSKCILSIESNSSGYKKVKAGEEVLKKLLIKSVNSIKCFGSSTCTIILFDKNYNMLYTCSVGDSCYMILRKNKSEGDYYALFRSKEQMHDHKFNTPYQLGFNCDDPSNSITNSHQLELNDIVILASDGYIN